MLTPNVVNKINSVIFAIICYNNKNLNTLNSNTKVSRAGDSHMSYRHSRMSVYSKITSLILTITFLSTNLCHGLSPLPASQNVAVKANIVTALIRNAIRRADTPELVDLLGINNTPCIIFNSGEYLISENLQTDIDILRAVIKQEINAVLQIIKNNDEDQFKHIAKNVLAEYPLKENKEAGYILDSISEHLSWFLLLKDRYVSSSQIPLAEKEGVKRLLQEYRKDQDLLKFDIGLWGEQTTIDIAREDARKTLIKKAHNRGMRFYSVNKITSVNEETVKTLEARIKNKYTENPPETQEEEADIYRITYKLLEIEAKAYLQNKSIASSKIDSAAMFVLVREAYRLGVYDIQAVLRVIFGKTSGEQIANEEVIEFFRYGRIKSSTMLFSPKMRPGDLRHSDRLKKDVPIKGGNRPYSPVMGESISSSMAGEMAKKLGIEKIIQTAKRENRPIAIVGKYTGGLVPGILLADHFDIPFYNLTKIPFFSDKGLDGTLVTVKEPHLPEEQGEMYSFISLTPGMSVIIIDDESTTGQVHTNTVKEFKKAGVKTEAVVVLLQSSDEAATRIRQETGVPYLYMNAAYTEKNWKPERPIRLPFMHIKVSAKQRLSPEGEADTPAEIHIRTYPDGKGKHHIDHSLKGATMPVDIAALRNAAKDMSESISAQIDIRKVFNEKTSCDRSLYVLGTTPSGIYAGLALSHQTRLPFISATNRPEPHGESPAVTYVGLDGYNYSIYGVKPGDSVLMVTGELVDGEEQLRVIKALKDQGIEVLFSCSVVENTLYNGRNAIEKQGIKVSSVKQYSVPEKVSSLNSTDKVMSSFKYALAKLESAVRQINPDAHVAMVKALPSSFTRGLMIGNSDMDEVFVYVEGVSQTVLDGIEKDFISWLNREDVILVDENAKPPILISTDYREALEAKYSLKDIPLIDIYANGKFKSKKELVDSNRKRSMLYPKHVARIIYLLSSGEIDPAHVKDLLAGEKNTENFYYELLENVLSEQSPYRLSGSALNIVSELDSLYRQGIWKWDIEQGREKEVLEYLSELREKHMISVIDGRIMLLWRQHTARWSDRFWTRRIIPSSRVHNANSILQKGLEEIENVGQKKYGDEESLMSDLLSGHPVKTVQALLFIRHNTDLLNKNDIRQKVLTALKGPIYMDGFAVDVIRDNRAIFEKEVKDLIKNLPKDPYVSDYFDREQKRLNLLINIVFYWARTYPEDADELVSFIRDNIIQGNELGAVTVPGMIFQATIEGIGECFGNLTNDLLKDELYLMIKRMAYNFEYRTSKIARKAIAKMDKVSSLKEKYSGAKVIDQEAKRDPQTEDLERVMLFREMEERRKLAKPVKSIVSDLDDSILRYRSGGRSRLSPSIGVWMNWLMANDVSFVLATGSGYERVHEKCLSGNSGITFKQGPNLHILSDTGAFYNDTRIEYPDIPREVYEYAYDLLGERGWIELNDGRLPRHMFLKKLPSAEDRSRAEKTARELMKNFRDKGYDFDVTLSSWKGPENIWALKIYAINKAYYLGRKDGIVPEPDRIMTLFDDAGEFGVDRPFLKLAEGGVNVNLGYNLEDENVTFNLKTKNEEGGTLAIQALAASTIMGLIEKNKPFCWEELTYRFMHEYDIAREDADEIIIPVRELVQDILDEVKEKEDRVLNEIVKNEDVIKAAPVYFIEIHPTNACNLKCADCIAGNRKTSHMFPFKELDKLGLMKPSEILVIGGGEPTLYRDGDKDFNDFINHMSEVAPQANIGVCTNGMIVPDGDWEKKVAWVSISLHGTSRESFKTFTGKDKYDVVWNNIFYHYLLNSPVKEIKISYVYSEDKISQIIPMLRNIWKEWKKVKPQLDKKGIKKSIAVFLQAEATDNGPERPFDILELDDQQKMQWTEETDRVKNEEPELWAFLEEYTPRLVMRPYSKIEVKPAEVCWIVSNYLLLGANGKVYPCCIMPSSAPKTNLGDITQPMEELLQKRKQFMANPPRRCRAGCHICATFTGHTVKNLLLRQFGDADVTKLKPDEEVSGKRDTSIEIMELHPTDRCNLNCSGCTFAQRHDPGCSKEVMPIEYLDKLAGYSPKQVRIVGGGEPTTYRYKEYTFNDYVMRLRKNLPDARIGVVTNGLKYSTGEWQNEAAWVGVSLYGANREDFIEYTGVDGFEEVAANALRYYSESPIKDVRITVFYSRDNIELIVPLIRLMWNRWKEIVSGDPLLLKEKRFLLNFSPYTDNIDLEDPYSHSNFTEEELAAYSEQLEQARIEEPELWAFMEKYASSAITRPFEKHMAPGMHKCPLVSKNAVLGADGKLYPCFIMANSERKYDFGHIDEATPEEVLKRRMEYINNTPLRCELGCHPSATYTGKNIRKGEGKVQYGYREGKTLVSKAAVTGATGDIGGALTRYLLSRECTVTALTRNLAGLEPIEKFNSKKDGLTGIEGTVFSRTLIEKMVSENDTIYHMAAIVGQDIKGEKDEQEVLAVNAFGTALLAWVIEKSATKPSVVYASSQRVYAVEERADVDEWINNVIRKFLEVRDSVFTGSAVKVESSVMSFLEETIKEYPVPEDTDIYDLSKLLGERFLENTPNVVFARISNVYGPGCASGRLIQRLVEARMTGQTVRVPDEKRDYIYENDAAKLLYELGGKWDLDYDSRVVDVATGKKISTRKVWDAITGHTPDKTGTLELYETTKTSADQDGEGSLKLLGRSFCQIETGLRNVIDEYRYSDIRPEADKSPVLVFDIGGTSIRTALFYPDGVLDILSKEEAPNFKANKESGIDELQDLLIAYIAGKFTDIKRDLEKRGLTLDSIGISFPGPVTNNSRVKTAATLWGAGNRELDLEKRLKSALPDVQKVSVMHDITADAVRYARERRKEKFCVITVSSGISCRIYDKDKGGLVVDEYDLAGEIGHLRVDLSEEAEQCDCGGKGHLNALSSGRAAEKLIRAKAAVETDAYKNSLLFELSGGDIASLDNRKFADAVNAGDTWALEILNEVTLPVANAVNHISTVSGVGDFVIVGGFAISMGEKYITSLKKHLADIKLLDREEAYFEDRMELGYSDDADGLRGIGYFSRYGHDFFPGEADKGPETKPGHVKEYLDAAGEPYVEASAPTDISYKNYFTRGVFGSDNDLLARLAGSRASLMVIDSFIYERYKDDIRKYIARTGMECTVMTVKGGEKAKDMQVVEEILKEAQKVGLNRKGVILAVGGGAVMDVAGLAAQLYRRKIKYIRVPTTLLGIIDAAVGVKVGVNYGASKNFLGSFYPPEHVVSDIDFIGSLPAREIRSGIAEIIKVALISNSSLFERLEEHGEDLVNGMPFPGYEKLIEDAAVELLKHLQKDFYENDLMRHVDFGHAMAHHFEAMSNYELAHGEAVGIDILISAHISLKRGILSEKDFRRIFELHKNIGLPFYHPALTMDTMWEGIKTAIAHKGGRLMMVVPKGVGHTVFIDSVSKDELAGALAFLKRMNSEDFLKEDDINKLVAFDMYMKSFDSTKDGIENIDEVTETVNGMLKYPVFKLMDTIKNPNLPEANKKRAREMVDLCGFEIDPGTSDIVLNGNIRFSLGGDNAYHPVIEPVYANEEKAVDAIRDKSLFIFDLEKAVTLPEQEVPGQTIDELLGVLKSGKTIVLNVLREFNAEDYDTLIKGRDLGVVKSVIEHADFTDDMFDRFYVYGPGASRKFTFRKENGKTVCEEDSAYFDKYGKQKYLKTGVADNDVFSRALYDIEKEIKDSIELDDRHVTYSDWKRYKTNWAGLGVTYFPNEYDRGCETWKLRILARRFIEAKKAGRFKGTAIDGLMPRIVPGRYIVFVKKSNSDIHMIKDLAKSGFSEEDIVYFANGVYREGRKGSLRGSDVTFIVAGGNAAYGAKSSKVIQLSTEGTSQQEININVLRALREKEQRSVKMPVELLRKMFSDPADEFPEGLLEAVFEKLDRISDSKVTIMDVKKMFPDNPENAKRRIVFSGSVYGGKTTFLESVKEKFLYNSVFVPEVMPTMIRGGMGVNPAEATLEEKLGFQRIVFIFKYLLEREISQMYPDKVVFLDRPALDCAGWWPTTIEEYDEEIGGISNELKRYRHIVYVRTVAATKHAQGELKHRFEDIHKAMRVDSILEKIWKKHESLYVVEHLNWQQKTRDLNNLVELTHAEVSSDRVPETITSGDIGERVIRSERFDDETRFALMFDILYRHFKDDRIYTVKYDESVLSVFQRETIREYAKYLQKKIDERGLDTKIRVTGFSGDRSSNRSLLEVDCRDISGDIIGESRITVKVAEGNLSEYYLRIKGMINLAILAASIPEDDTGSYSDYGHMIGMIKNQYKNIIGEDMNLPNTPQGLIKALRYITLLLPKEYKLPAKFDMESFIETFA